ncbi:MAG: glycosyltransferase family 2 protein [Candidatus Riflebacteria bacterium]|nr:glycosyltransferase family 2 protein [Candidatus Riflebacteria bacterium]
MFSSDQITVIIPAFNPGKFLEEAIDSIETQSVHPGRVLIIDDGSAPPIRLSEKHRSFPIEIVRQSNAGQAKARNVGVSIATTPLIAFLDADDLWHPFKLEWQLTALQQYPDTTCVGCRSVLVDASGKCIGSGPGSFTGGLTILSYPDFAQGAADAVLVPSMVVMKRQTIIDIPAFNPAFQPIEDIVFFDGFFKAGGNAVMIDQPLLKRRMHGNNLTFRYADMLRGYLKWITERVEPCGNSDLTETLRSRAYLVTGLSALSARQTCAARSLLRRSWNQQRNPKTLFAFFFACLGSWAADLFRRIKHSWSGQQGETRLMKVAPPDRAPGES